VHIDDFITAASPACTTAYVVGRKSGDFFIPIQLVGSTACMYAPVAAARLAVVNSTHLFAVSDKQLYITEINEVVNAPPSKHVPEVGSVHFIAVTDEHIFLIDYKGRLRVFSWPLIELIAEPNNPHIHSAFPVTSLFVGGGRICAVSHAAVGKTTWLNSWSVHPPFLGCREVALPWPRGIQIQNIRVDNAGCAFGRIGSQLVQLTEGF
jgi:hypothetical protein